MYSLGEKQEHTSFVPNAPGVRAELEYSCEQCASRTPTLITRLDFLGAVKM